LGKILSTCQNDDNVSLNSDKFQKSTHKIKGLAPMMGKEELGELTALLDTMFKKISEGKQIEGIFDILTDSIHSMNNSMTEPDYDLNPITDKIKQFLSSF